MLYKAENFFQITNRDVAYRDYDFFLKKESFSKLGPSKNYTKQKKRKL